jgi:hypothetical protein
LDFHPRAYEVEEYIKVVVASKFRISMYDAKEGSYKIKLKTDSEIY